jgi:hypothetical protein
MPENRGAVKSASVIQKGRTQCQNLSTCGQLTRSARAALQFGSWPAFDNAEAEHWPFTACDGVKSIRREFMQSHGPAASSSVASTTTIAVRAFSKTIAVTYVGLGLFGLFFLVTSFYGLYQAVVSRLPMFLIPGAVALSLGIGFIYVMWALYERHNWARHAAVSFWLLCLIWTSFRIVRNGLHPQPPTGPLQYSNAEQLAGARFTTLVTPYFMAMLELAAIYCLLRRAKVVNQFKRSQRI